MFPVNILLRELGDPPVIDQCMKGMRSDRSGAGTTGLGTDHTQPPGQRKFITKVIEAFLSHFVR